MEKRVIHNGEEYIRTETDTEITLRSINKSKRGLYHTLVFTKDKEVHKKTMGFLTDFIARELI